jgi:hypothetical protein
MPLISSVVAAIQAYAVSPVPVATGQDGSKGENDE